MNDKDIYLYGPSYIWVMQTGYLDKFVNNSCNII